MARNCSVAMSQLYHRGRMPPNKAQLPASSKQDRAPVYHRDNSNAKAAVGPAGIAAATSDSLGVFRNYFADIELSINIVHVHKRTFSKFNFSASQGRITTFRNSPSISLIPREQATRSEPPASSGIISARSSPTRSTGPRIETNFPSLHVTRLRICFYTQGVLTNTAWQMTFYLV
jgi:hypothetical protein